MSNIITELKEKRKEIEQFQRDKANQEGQEAQLLKQLQDECSENSIEKAEEVIKRETEELGKHEEFLKELGDKLDKIIYNALPRSNSESS